jgi:hypothetical protein
MSPTQAREVIEAAAERIAEWKSRLKINTGRGVETWDNKTGQMISVRVPQEEPVKEPLVLTPYLWVNTIRVSVLDPVYVPATEFSPGYLLDEGRTVIEQTGWYVHQQLSGLASGEYVNEEGYKNPNALTPVTELGYYPNVAGYFYPTNAPAMEELAPFDSWSNFIVEPEQPITAGALYLPETIYSDYDGLRFVNRTTTTVTMEVSIRGYNPDYLDDRARRDLLPEFEKGEGIGSYDLMIRQEDAIQGPSFYVPPYVDGDGIEQPGGYTWATTPLLTSSRERIGFVPKTLTFASRDNGPKVWSPGWTSRGDIAVMGYRKV